MGRAGYWRPDPGTSMTDNDLIAIPTGAKNPSPGPRVHQLLPRRTSQLRQLPVLERLPAPLTSLDPDKLIADGVVPPTLLMAVVSQDMFREDLTPYELRPEVDQLWQAAWTEIKAGA